MAGSQNSVVWIITLFLLLSFGVLVVMHPKGFSNASGTIFKGFNSWGQTVSGTNYKGG